MESMQHISTTHQKDQSSACEQNYQEPSKQNQSLNVQTEQNHPLERTEDIAIQHSEQNCDPCLGNQRMEHTAVGLYHLLQTIMPHVEESKVMALQMLHDKLKLKGNQIDKGDFVRHLRAIAGMQLFLWGLENMEKRTLPSSMTTPLRAGKNMDMSSKKRSIAQMESLEATHCAGLLLSRKKKKLSGGIPEQSIRELDEVTAPSGVNIREENQISSEHNEEVPTTETGQKDAQKEEGMILQKIPLHRKLADIMSKYGITHISNSVEGCLSMGVEERMRAVITNLINMSKTRVDPEVPALRKSITSDVRSQILMINRKAKEVYQKEQAEEDIMPQKGAEAKKLANDDIQITPTVASQTAVEEVDLQKLELLAEQARRKHDWRISAANKAANIAVQTAVGGQDLLLRWKLMAEQAREKCQSIVHKDASQAALSPSRRATCFSKEPGNTSAGPNSPRMSRTKSATVRKPGRRDVIAVFEREGYMSKSTLLYRLYEKNVC